MKGASFSSTVTLQHLKLSLENTIIRVVIATVCVYDGSNVHAPCRLFYVSKGSHTATQKEPAAS